MITPSPHTHNPTNPTQQIAAAKTEGAARSLENQCELLLEFRLSKRSKHSKFYNQQLRLDGARIAFHSQTTHPIAPSSFDFSCTRRRRENEANDLPTTDTGTCDTFLPSNKEYYFNSHIDLANPSKLLPTFSPPVENKMPKSKRSRLGTSIGFCSRWLLAFPHRFQAAAVGVLPAFSVSLLCFSPLFIF
jgi:hypothetical protein